MRVPRPDPEVDRSEIRRWRLLAALVGLAMTGCPEWAPSPHLVAEVDGQSVPYSDFETFLTRNSVEGVAVLGSDVLSALLDQFLDERLLHRLAVERLDLDRELEAPLAIESLLDSQQQAIEPAEIAAHYRRHLGEFQRPERVALRQLLVTDRATADAVRDRWAAGTPYGQVLESFADSPAVHVGEEGEFSRAALPPAFAEIVFAMGENDVSEVVTADYGFHVFQVVRHLAPGVAPLVEVAPGIRMELEHRRREETVSRLVAEARERYNVRVFDRNVPFNYDGRYGSTS